eukprot:scaffold358_cov207-Alexandrium_tamarense.AAC.4
MKKVVKSDGVERFRHFTLCQGLLFACAKRCFTITQTMQYNKLQHANPTAASKRQSSNDINGVNLKHGVSKGG